MHYARAAGGKTVPLITRKRAADVSKGPLVKAFDCDTQAGMHARCEFPPLSVSLSPSKQQMADRSTSGIYIGVSIPLGQEESIGQCWSGGSTTRAELWW